MQMAREDAPDLALFMPRLLPRPADPSRQLRNPCRRTMSETVVRTGNLNDLSTH
jgi:hypothetical protein